MTHRYVVFNWMQVRCQCAGALSMFRFTSRRRYCHLVHVTTYRYMNGAVNSLKTINNTTSNVIK